MPSSSRDSAQGMPVRIDPPALPGWEPAFAAVREHAAKRGLRALVVGGYVRDRLMGGEREKQIREVDILVANSGGPPASPDALSFSLDFGAAADAWNCAASGTG